MSNVIQLSRTEQLRALHDLSRIAAGHIVERATLQQLVEVTRDPERLAAILEEAALAIREGVELAKAWGECIPVAK